MTRFLPFLVFAVFIYGSLAGQQTTKIQKKETGTSISNIVWNTGSKVIKCSDFKKTIPVRDMPQVTPMTLPDGYLFEQMPDKRDMPVQTFEFTVEKDGAKYGNDPSIIQTVHGKGESKAPIQNWDGYVNAGGRPNDPTGAAGPNYYIQATNGDTYRIFDKAGNIEHTGLISDLVGGDGDPIVFYDQPANRWFIGQFGGSGDNGLYIAISATSDPLGSWYGYTFTSPDFPDYEKFSAWHDGYYMTANYAQKIFAFNRTKMLAGDATAEAVYQTFSPPQSGFFVPMPADVSDGTATSSGPCPVFCYQDDGWSGVSTDAINVYNASVDWNALSMTVTQAASISTSSFDASYDSGWDDVEQPGTTQKLDGIGGAMGFRAQFKPWTGYNTVVMTWAVQVTTSQRGIFWCELRQDQTSEEWSLYQEGIYAPGTDNVWLGSIAMNDAGHIALAYSKTNPAGNVYMSLAYTGRLSCDPLGTLPISEVVAVAGAGYQTGLNRVGDYAHTALDPDGVTFWHTGEYMYQNGQWDAAKTRIFSFQLPGACAPPTNVSATPTSLYKDRGKQVTVTGNDLSGCTFEIGGVTGNVSSNDGSTAIVDFPAGDYSNGTLTVSNAQGEDTYAMTIQSRTTIPVDASTGFNTDVHQTIDGAVDGLYGWLGSTGFTTQYVIEVADGAYSEGVTLNSGLAPTSENNLVIQNASGTTPVVDATGNDYGFDLSSVDNVLLSGFAVHSADEANVFLQGNNCEVVYNKLYNGSTADGIRIAAGGTNNIHNNLIYNNERYAIHIINSSDNSIKNNTTYTNGGSYVPLTDVELFYDSFENDPESTWTLGSAWSVYEGIPHSGTYFLGVTNVNSANSTYSPVIDISGYTNIDIECYASAYGGPDSRDFIKGYYSLDGGAYVEFFSMTGTDGDVDYTLQNDGPLSGGEPYSTIQFRFDGKCGRSEYWLLDDVKVLGDEDVVGGNVGSEVYVESGSGNAFENNIIYTKNGTDFYAVKTETTVTISSDYNTYYANGNSNLFDYNGTVGNTGPIGSNDLTGDPLFVNVGSDFHIQSQSGSYAGGNWPPTSASGGTWTNNASNSPALDAGNPADVFINEPSGGTAINQGAYGNTVQASKSESTYAWEGDDATSPTDWTVTENWSGGMVPGSESDVTIPASCANYPSISGAADCRNITIESGATFTLTTGLLSVYGNWINNGTFNAGTGTVVFKGVVDQTLSGSSPNVFNNLTVNAVRSLILSQNISIGGTLLFTSGCLNIADRTVDLGTTGSISGESNTNYIFGTTGTINAYDRAGETGVGNNIAGLGIEISSGAITDLDLVRGVQGQAGFDGASSLKKYFDLTATPNSGLNATMKMYYFNHEFDASNGGEDEKYFVLYRSTDGGTTWDEKYEATVDDVENSLYLTGIDAFSRWTVSSKSEQPLPVLWHSYNAISVQNNIKVNWTTLSEENNDFFTVEKIADNGDYVNIGTVNGEGNSNVAIQYSLIDDAPKAGENYYRIKQTDFNGESSYSPVFSATFNNDMFEPEINIFPNPFKDQIKIFVSRGYSGELKIEILNSRGVLIKENKFELSGSNSIGLRVNTSELSKGMYLVRVSGKMYSSSQILVKQ